MKRLFANTLVTSLDYFILVALNLLATPILITHFGVEGYGAFVFLSIFSIYGALSFFDLGMEGSLMNYVARFDVAGDRRKLQDTLSISVLYYAVIGCVLGIALYLSAGFVAARLLGDNGTLNRAPVLASIAYIAVTIFIQFLTIPFTATLQGMRRFTVSKGLNVVMNIMRYVLVIAAAVLYHRIDIAFLIILGLTLVRLAALVLIFLIKTPYFRRMEVRIDFSLLRTLVSYSSILLVSRLIGLIWNQIDKVLIWLYMAVANMTVYDVIARPATLLRLVMGILNSAIIPEVARLHEIDDIAAIRRLYIRLVRFAYLILLPILAVLFVYIDDLLRLWVGESFVPHAPLAMILLSTYLVLPIPSVASTVVVGLEKVRQTIWIPIVSTIINVALSIILLHVMGMAGLLVATLCSNMVSTPLYLIVIARFLGFTVRDIARPLSYIALPSAASFGLNLFVRHGVGGHHMLMGGLAAAIFLANCLINYRYLLSTGEKAFLMERLSAMRTRLTPDILARWL